MKLPREEACDESRSSAERGQHPHQANTDPRTLPVRQCGAAVEELGIQLPEPFGAYAEAVQTGNWLFLTGMLPTEGRTAKFVGRVGGELNVEVGRMAAHLAALNGLAVAREYLRSLEKVARIVRLRVSVATCGDFRDHPKVADGASELLQGVLAKDKDPSRLVYGLAGLPLGVPVGLELISEIAG